MKSAVKRGIVFAVIAAAFYAINSPFSKLLLNYMQPTLMAGFLYIGAGVGMCAVKFIKSFGKNKEKTAIKRGTVKADIPFIILMILLDIAAPICLLLGLRATTAANASLLNNFEIVATALISLTIFKERISPRLWVGILFIVTSCALLSFEDASSIKFSYGSLFIILACVCWGFENNCTKKISSLDPLQIVFLKGVFSGTGSIMLGLIIGERIEHFWSILAVIGVGLVAYGLSIYFYVHAQRLIGAARTSAYYAVAPFIGAILSMIILNERPDIVYFISLAFMLIGAWLSSSDKPLLKN